MNSQEIRSLAVRHGAFRACAALKDWNGALFWAEQVVAAQGPLGVDLIDSDFLNVIRSLARLDTEATTMMVEGDLGVMAP
jgi:hypothetical protein